MVIVVNLNSKAIAIICSRLCIEGDLKPYEPSEWAKLAERLISANIMPYEVLSFSDDDLKSRLDFCPDEIERLNRLSERSGCIAQEIERFASMGINIMTRADTSYPKALKQKLGNSCPPIFYYAGNPALLGKKCVGFVGSRSANEDDEAFTVRTVKKCNSNGLAVVSGGARGVDSIAQAASIDNGSSCIAYIPDSLAKRIRDKSVADAVLHDQLVILSVANPDAGFTAGMALMRNKYIYSQSVGTVVVKSDFNKGGTWRGATDNLRKNRCVTFCWNNPAYKGNLELISRGAIPIDEEWNADVIDLGHFSANEK